MATERDGQEPKPKPSQTPPKTALERLAQRSTGLPGDVSPKQPEVAEPSRMRLAGLGLQTAATVVAAVFIGRWIDRHFGWNYAATLTLAMISLIGNLYLLIKDAMKVNK